MTQILRNLTTLQHPSYQHSESWKFHFIQQPHYALHLSATPIHQLQESEKDTVRSSVSMISGQWDSTAALTSFALKSMARDAFLIDLMEVILSTTLIILFCRALQEFWKSPCCRRSDKNCFKRSEEWLFWHTLTLHYSFCTGRTSDRYKGIQYTWPGGGRGKWALLQKIGIIAYTQIKLLDINDLRYLTLENRETNSHSAFTVVNNHPSSCLLQCSIYSIHKQLNQL